MFNHRVLAVLKRELREKLMSKSFILMTILIPVFMFGIIGVQTLVMSYEGDSNTKVEVITESAQLTQKCELYFDDLDFVKDGTYKITYNTVAASDIRNYIDNKKQDLMGDKLTGIIFIPEKALENKKLEYYSNTPSNRTIPQKLDGPVNKVLLDEYFSNKNLSEDELQFARMGIDFSSFKVSEKNEIEEQGFGNTILAYLFSFMLYISLLFSGQMTMQSVQEEKNSKIVEVLLSSVSSKELMTGKIFGSTITSTFQMAIWLLPVLAIISTTWFVLPPEFVVDITVGHLIYFLINFFLAVIIFHGLFATVGAIFENSQEAQSGMWPVMLLIMIPFFISFSILRNPNNPMAVVSSYLPFATLMVMPGRYTVVDLPLWQLFVSGLVNVATIAAIFPLAGKIYRVGILRTGKKPSWSEVIKWMKYKY